MRTTIQIKKINTSFQVCYEVLKLSCAVWPEVKAGKRIMVNDIIQLMQHGGDLVWWDGDGVNTGLSDLGSPSLNPPCMGTCEHRRTLPTPPRAQPRSSPHDKPMRERDKARQRRRRRRMWHWHLQEAVYLHC